MPSSSKIVVDIDNRMPQFARQVEDAVDDSLRAVGQKVAATARGETGGYNIGGITSNLDVGTPYQSRGVPALDVVARDFRAIFFEKGTYTRRRAKLKQPRRSTSSNRGVRAIRFLGKAIAAHRGDFYDELERRIPR